MPAEHPVARQGVLEERADRVFVGDAEMVGFEAALIQDLPVRRPFPALLVNDPQGVRAEPGEIPRQAAEQPVDIRRSAGAGRDPDPAVGFRAAKALQAQLGPVDAGKAGGAVGYARECAAVVVGPGVVGAGEAAPAASRRADQPGAAVAADVEEGVRATIRIAGQEQGQAGMIAGQEGVRPCQFAAVSRHRGHRAEQRLHFPGEPVRAGVAGDRPRRHGVVEIEGPRRAQAAQLFQQFEFRCAVHGGFPAAFDGPIGRASDGVW